MTRHSGLFFPIHTSCCCRTELITIRCGTSMAFSVLDSYVETNLSNLIANQTKISFIRRKWTVVIKGKIQFLLIFQIKKFDRNETVCIYNFEMNQYTCMVVHVILIRSFNRNCLIEWVNGKVFINGNRSKEWLTFHFKIDPHSEICPSTERNM